MPDNARERSPVVAKFIVTRLLACQFHEISSLGKNDKVIDIKAIEITCVYVFKKIFVINE